VILEKKIETTETSERQLDWNVPWMEIYKICVFGVDQISNTGQNFSIIHYGKLNK
jgi:hypothetical protein